MAGQGRLSTRFYRWMWYMATPVLPALSAYKSRGWRALERLGIPTVDRPASRPVWIHVASVGEGLSALPLVERIAVGSAQSCGHPIVLTCGTSTAREVLPARVSQLVSASNRSHNPHSTATATATVPTTSAPSDGVVDGGTCSISVQHVPWDSPICVHNFLSTWNPSSLILVESELWPNIVRQAHSREVRILIVNGRMSDRSYRRWIKYAATRSLIRHALSCIDGVLCQTPDDVSRFRELGATNPRVGGNMKTSASHQLPVLSRGTCRLLEALDGVGKEMWVAGSTHEGEEKMLLEAMQRLVISHPSLVLVLVPRHIERANTIATLCSERGLSFIRRSRFSSISDTCQLTHTNVVIFDILGELSALYPHARVAFLGGTLVPVGGHNPAECWRGGCAVLHGSHTHNVDQQLKQMERICPGSTHQVDSSNLSSVVARLVSRQTSELKLVIQESFHLCNSDDAVGEAYNALNELIPQQAV